MGTPTYRPQNDPHDAMIIWNIHKGGKNYLFQNLFCTHQHRVKTNKIGSWTWDPIFSTPPPPHTIPGLPNPLCDIPSGCCFFTGPWTVTRSSLHMLRRVAAFCRPLRPVLLLVLFTRSWSPVVGVGVPFARQRRPVVGILRLCWLLWGSFDWFCCPHTSVLRPSTICLSVFPCA